MKKKGLKKSKNVRGPQARGKTTRKIRRRNIPKPAKVEEIIMMAGEPETERGRVERAPLPPVPQENAKAAFREAG